MKKTIEEAPIKLFCRSCAQKVDVSELKPFSLIPCPNCGTTLRVPKRFDRYLLEKLCGIGGMSKVYRAIDPDLARRVAVKILNSEFTAEYHGCEQFIYEAKLVARISHPGVIPIYDCGVYDEQPFLVMRYMERGSLEAMLKSQTMPDVSVVCAWLTTITEGLAAALKLDIIHHDIKPGNILIADTGEAGLGDFDLADVRDSVESFLTATGWASPAYVSPERLTDGHEDFQGDIFSLGVTAYELVTGQLPFDTQGETEDLVKRRRHPFYTEAHLLNPAISPRFSDLLNRMMSFDPAKRPLYPEIIDIFSRESKGTRETMLTRLKRFFRLG